MLHSERRVFQGKQFAPVVSGPYMGLFFFAGDFILLFFFISLQFYNNCSYRQHPQFLPLLELSGVTLKISFFIPAKDSQRHFMMTGSGIHGSMLFRPRVASRG